MVIVVQIEELKEEVRPHFKSGTISGLSIDYATNSIHGYTGNLEHVVFRFEDCGVRLDNKRNSYELSSGSAGVMIRIDAVS